MIKQEKTYSVAGTATGPDGVTKVRWANDLVSRIKILHKSGCTHINLVALPQPMTKFESLVYLKTQQLDTDAAYAVECKYAEKIKVHRRHVLTMTGLINRPRTEQAAAELN